MHRKVISNIINISNEPKHSDFALTKVDLVELFFINKINFLLFCYYYYRGQQILYITLDERESLTFF